MMAEQVRRQLEIAPRNDDPWYWGLWGRLPNPDKVLRKSGRDQSMYDQIQHDAHVVGELRAIRAGLLAFEWRITLGDGSRAAHRANDLVHDILNRPPDHGGHWPDVIWNIAQAVFRGYAVHDIIWSRDGMYIIPERIVDRPNRRFVFDADNNQLKVLTRSHPFDGEPIPDKQVLLTRHMPSYDNPYGIAVFSACFWPYVFKHSGFKYFVTFCEKFGVPWVVGKYPNSGDDNQANEIVDALSQLISNAVAAVPEGVDLSVEENSSATGRNTPQERLIQTCNSELSKALTSQTLATEIQGQGSRAASETHLRREQGVHHSDRKMICATMNQLFRWVTDVNFGEQVAAPMFNFYEESDAHTAWAELFDKARHYLPIRSDEAYERLGLTSPKEGEATLSARPASAAPLQMSSCPGCGAPYHFSNGDGSFRSALETTIAIAEHPDQIAEYSIDLVQPVIDAANHNPEALMGRLAELYPRLDDEQINERLSKLLFVAELLGQTDIDHA